MLRRPWNALTGAQRSAYGWGLVMTIAAGTTILLPGRESWHAAGPPNVGHTRIACGECHTPAAGGIARQVFTNVMHAAGLSETGADFVYTPAGNAQCLACHENSDDRHPVAKFLEPEFATARQTTNVQLCTGCHQEHLGVRTNVSRLVCGHCHEETVVEDDPVDVPHATLFGEQRWGTCLGCHDFHGNHKRKAPALMSEALTERQIQLYLDGGQSPYGPRRLTAIQTMRRDDD